MSGATFLPRDEALQHASLRMPSPTQSLGRMRTRSPPRETGADNSQLERLLTAAAAQGDSRGLGVGTETSSALGRSLGTGQGAALRTVAQVTSHLNRSLAILVKKKQPIDLGNQAPKALRQPSPEEHNARSKSVSHNYPKTPYSK